jgi:tetratricopeptide (TPR) repeat protein
MEPRRLVIAAAAGWAVLNGTDAPARAEGFVTILGVSPSAACAAAAAEAARTGVTTRAGLEACTRAIDAGPMPAVELATAYVNRAVVELAGDNPGAAIRDTAAALRLAPALAEAHLNRGIALSAENRPDQAIAAFTQAISLHPRHPELAYFDRAMAREDTGDVKGAYVDLRHAALINPAWQKPRDELARFTVLRVPTS